MKSVKIAFKQCNQLGQVPRLSLAGTPAHPHSLSKFYSMLHTRLIFLRVKAKCRKEVGHTQLVGHKNWSCLKNGDFAVKLTFQIVNFQNDMTESGLKH